MAKCEIGSKKVPVKEKETAKKPEKRVGHTAKQRTGKVTTRFGK